MYDTKSYTPLGYAIVDLSLVPLRAFSEDIAEMVTQVLFGEYMKVLKNHDKWCFVELEQDGYRGWVKQSQIRKLTEKEFADISCIPKTKIVDNFVSIATKEGTLLLVKGTSLPFYSEGSFVFKGQKIPVSAKVIQGKQTRKELIETTYSYLNTPYLWGGKTLWGIDCSGFTQMVYHSNGYSIARDASQQALQGELVPFLVEAQPGDLAFFDDEEGRITHVGIVLKEQKLIHAYGANVHIDNLDQEGVYCSKTGKFTHKLRMVRRYF